METVRSGGRIPPHSIEAEQCTLGSMLLDEDAIAEVFGMLKSDDFYRTEHRDIFNSIDALYSAGKSVDIITLGEALRKNGKLEKCGGLEYLAAIAEQVPSAASAHHYAEIVEDKAIIRALIKSSGEILEMGYENQEDARKVMDFAQSNIFDIAMEKENKGVTHISDILEENLKTLTKLYKEGNRVPGIPSGYADLDKLTAGFQPSDLILIAARPSMGKSSLALNIAQHVALQEGMSVAIFSLEMSKEQVVNRILSSEMQIENMKLKTGDINSDEWQKIAVASAQISEASIYVDDTSDISAAEMRAKCRRLKLKKKLDMVIIDYIQLIAGGKRNESRQQEITEISRNLKILAKDLHIPVIALSQLSRAPEQRQNHRPMLSDLRESGAIEQDADMVMFIYRDDYYDKQTENPNVTELIVAKNRNGSTGDVKLRWHAEFTKFSNLALS
ncbi:MAG: replicative DNA helicase [Clostridia bacterium]|nr:replicative DNA helicase [Clostridia bacterium]